MQAGGWDCLYDVEKSLFVTEYARIKNHPGANDPDITEEISGSLNLFINGLAQPNKELVATLVNPDVLVGLPKNDLIKRLKNFSFDQGVL